MTTPEDPWLHPTAPQPAVPPKRRMGTGRLIALCVLAVVVLCVGGLATLGAIIGPAKPATVAGQEPKARPLVVVPTTAATTDPAPTPDLTLTPTAPALEATSVKPPPRRVVPKPKPKPAPTTHKPKPKPKLTKPPTSGVVHPGAFCSPEGALGHTSAGTLMRCTRKAGEDRARWRKA